MSAKQTADRLEQKRLEHERTRLAQRAKFEEQMRLLEAEQLAEEHQLLSGEAASAPTTPPGRSPAQTPVDAAAAGAASVAGSSVKPEPIGPPQPNGAKSMPASRRTSGSAGTFGLEKLSLSVMGAKPKGKDWAEDEDVDAEGAQSGFLMK